MSYQEEFNITEDPERMLYLLRNHSDKIDPSANNNEAIIQASKNGYTKVVKLLLKHPKVDPSVRSNNALEWASINGHLEVVKELLKDPRIDPSTWDSHSLRLASANNHIEVVKELLKDDRVYPFNSTIFSASSRGYFEIVKLLEDHIKYGKNKKFYSRILRSI